MFHGQSNGSATNAYMQNIILKTLQYQVPLYFSSAFSDVSPFMLQFHVSSVNVTIINDFLISVVEMFYKLNIFQWNSSTRRGQVPLCLPAELSAGLWVR